MGGEQDDAIRGVARRPRPAIGVGRVVGGELGIGDGSQPVILVAVVDGLARGLEVRGNLLREVRSRIEHIVRAPGVGADERHPPPEIIVGRAGDVAGVAGDGAVRVGDAAGQAVRKRPWVSRKFTETNALYIG